jgi:hypothetical protein
MEKPDITKLSLNDRQDEQEEDVEDLFASPESGATTSKHTPTSQQSSAHKKQQSRQVQDDRDARLRAELEKVREVNKVIEGVTASLQKAQANMSTVNQTVQNASTLLATWTRILSQTEHNQRLILNPTWGGATQDLEEIENEEVRRRQEEERRAREEERRREEAVRKAEDEERRRIAAANVPGGRGAKSRGVRGTTSSTRGYTSVGGQTGRGRGTTSSTRGSGGSGIARSSSVRGRGRGLG